jgi:hypothetical protein
MKVTPCPTTLSAEGGSELKVYDPTTENSKKWETKLQDLEALREAVQDPAIPTRTVKLQPGQLCVMANPLPHEVLPITAGVRISLVMFYGPQV